MDYYLDAACCCHVGNVRRKNEDNFFFNSQKMNLDHGSLENILSFRRKLDESELLAVFDGMGGENYGEYASYYAAEKASEFVPMLKAGFEFNQSLFFEMCDQLNNAVLEQQKFLHTTHMGSTMVSLVFDQENVYVINLGDSRAYRFRNGKLKQLSKDHIYDLEEMTGKPPLTQHLGISHDEFYLEPFVAKGKISAGDVYLICSDGITDMIGDERIREILGSSESASSICSILQETALENGGRDNITAIVCLIKTE